MTTLVYARQVRPGDVIHHTAGAPRTRESHQGMLLYPRRLPRPVSRRRRVEKGLVKAVESFSLDDGAHVTLTVKQPRLTETFSIAADTELTITPGPEHHVAAPLPHSSYALDIDGSVGLSRPDRLAAANDHATSADLLHALAVVSPESDVLEVVAENPSTPASALIMLASRTRWAVSLSIAASETGVAQGAWAQAANSASEPQHRSPDAQVAHDGMSL